MRFLACLLSLGAVCAACSQKVETKPPAIDPPSAAAAPPPVDPEIVCADQHPTRVTLHGERFVSTPIDVPGAPKAAMPTVTLSRSHELDGTDVASPDRVVYSGDYDQDPTNALDASGELILVDGQPLLSWTSQREMSFLVTQDLVQGEKPDGDDDRERGMLAAGVWDVRVENRSGDGDDSLGALAVVERPKLESLSPGIVCLAQGPRTITLAGQTFLRNGNQQTQLAVTGAETRFPLVLSDCADIAHVGLDAAVCATGSIELAQDAIAVGYPGLTLENPETAACSSEEQVSLRVVAPPRVTGVVDALACIADGGRSFEIQGSDFLRVDGTVTPTVTVGDVAIAVSAMECAAPLAAGEHMIELCTSITIGVMPGDLEPGLYDVSVVNPDNPGHPDNGDPPGCSALAMDALRIVPPPTIDAVEPSYVCLEDGTREVVIHGSDFLVVGGEPPTVEVDGAALASADVEAAGCGADALDVGGLTVERCDRLVLTLADGDVPLGSPTIQVQNPAPAGCSIEAMDLWTVLPRPTLASATPLLICSARGDQVVTLTGEGFLELDGDAPTVMAGDVAADSVEAADCEDIDGRSDARLCTELEATFGDDLVAGVHDLVVINTDPAGCETQETIELVAVDPPEVASVTPNPVCLEEDIEITITGSNFVRLDGDEPSVMIGAVMATDVAVIDASCEDLDGTDDGVICTELTATVEMGALSVDTSNRVSVTNPGTLDCASDDEVDLEIVPPPTITSLDDANVCTGGGTIAITGTGLAGITARLVDPDTSGVIDALNTVVNDDGTQATITFGSGVQPDTYELVIAGPSGCGDTAAQNVVAITGPVAFFLDPPVAYNGVSLRATVYASGVSTAPAGVILTPEGGGSVDDQEALDDVTWPAGSANKIGATIPAGLDEGTYDVTIDFATGCDAVLAAGVTIEADTTIALLDPALRPQFGLENTEVAVNVQAEATAELGADEVNFQATPRAYLSGQGGSLVAEPLRAVAFDTEERLTAIVPDTLPAGLYDLVVVNSDGSVGFQAGAYQATALAPPTIDDITPTQLDNDVDRPITITGTDFGTPATDIEVTLECLGAGDTTPDILGPLTLDGASTDTSIVATVPDGISHGSICVVRVTSTINDTFDEYSAITVTNPASKLPAFRVGTDLIEGRRAPAAALGAATREARFVYAIGGDDGTSANALSSVEAAPIGRFGDLGAFRTVATELPDGVTHAHAVSGGRYVYLLGGLIDDMTSAAIHRAVVLDPNLAPALSTLDLRFFATPDTDPGTRDGLAPGAWTYVIAAVFDAGDEDNPGGESLPSEPITLYAPDVPDGVEIQLDWSAVFGADGLTEAVTYRIYRTTTPNAAIASLRLLAEVSAPTHTFVDQNPASFLDPGKLPLSIGDLGEWRTLPDELVTARAAYGVSLANDPSCDPYLYVVGGRADASSESATYEYASFDPLTGDLGAFTQATATGLTARRELSAFVADETTSAQITPVGGCEAYVYASHGRNGASSFVTTVQEAGVTAGGALGAFTDAGPAPQNAAGHNAFFSSDGAYVMGGASNSADAVDTAVQAEMCSGGGCSAPDLRNFSSASNSLTEARYMAGFVRQGAFFYLLGGADAAGVALDSTESNVR